MRNIRTEGPCEMLFTPLKINSMTVKNRLVMTAMHLNYTSSQVVTDQLIDFYAERVAGGAGLICIGGCTIDPVGGAPFMLGAYDDKFIPGLATFVEKMKAVDPDCMICAQLYHSGRYAMSWLTGQQPVSASSLGSRFNRELPHALELDEIPESQQKFVDATIRFKKAGFDTVEIIASAGYLISQFLSPASNKREDEYGGPFKNRLRFGVEVIEKTRKAVGPDYPLLVRIAGADLVPGGHTNAESAEVCTFFEKAGADCFNVTGGWHEARVPQLTMAVPRGAFVHLAHGIKKRVNVPVVACNRINDPLLAEEILQNGLADLVGVARGFIADPQFGTKAKAQKYHLIRKCIACNQGCFDSVFMGVDVTCLVNYRAGKEGYYKSFEKVAEPKKVLVIGGGPAGCEAARVAAEKGHAVTLLEKTTRLGGALHLCAAPPGREEFLELVSFFNASLKELNVDVRLNTEATFELVQSFSPDVVVFSEGAKPIVPPVLKNAEMDNVFLAQDVLLNKKRCYGDTVIVGGGAVGCETALHLAAQGTISPETAAFLIETHADTADHVATILNEPIFKVHLVEMLPKIGEEIGKSTRWTMMLELRRLKVNIHKHTKVISIEKNGVNVETPDGEQFIQCVNVVNATGFRIENSLAEKLIEQGFEVKIIGDAKQPRRAIDAIAEGFKTGWNL